MTVHWILVNDVVKLELLLGQQADSTLQSYQALTASILFWTHGPTSFALRYNSLKTTCTCSSEKLIYHVSHSILIASPPETAQRLELRSTASRLDYRAPVA